MIKKGIAVVALVLLVSTGAFAQLQMSAGGGLLFDMSLNNGVEFKDAGSGGMNVTTIGGFGFFDLTYAVIDLSFGYGIAENWSKDKDGKDEDLGDNKDGGSMIQLGIGVLGKYPIAINDKITLFPMVGVNFNMVLETADKDGNKGDGDGKYWDMSGDEPKESTSVAENSQFSILAGVGADFGITEALFFRAEALFNLRLPAKATNDMIKDNDDATALPGVGPRIKLSIGYKF